MPQAHPLRFLSRHFRRRANVFYHGHSLEEDLKRRGIAPSLIFDVGANVGQTARRLVRAFPQAAIHSFEPFRDTYAKLNGNVSHEPRIKTHCLALGADPGKVVVELRGSLINSLKPSDTGPTPDTPTETLTVDTVDAFCARHEIDTIDFLKIDTEGYDMEVLKGGLRLLEAQRVNLVQVEAGMNPDNHKHVPLQEFQSFLEPRGYQLLGLYDQTPEWSGELRLRFCNPVFICTGYMESVGRYPLRGVNGEGFRWR
jgi:FkbM family methyltransferase